MTELVLDEREQRALRSILATEERPGDDLPARPVVQPVTRLIACDDAGLAVLDRDGREPSGGGYATPWTPTAADVLRPGVTCRARRSTPSGGRTGVAVLSFTARMGTEHLVILWLVRRRRDFADRDVALLELVTPALKRLMERRPTTSVASLTSQERRVLHHVGRGRSNAEIALELCIAPCTVRKHLENAYRKLGVGNRLAAVVAVSGALTADDDARSVPV